MQPNIVLIVLDSVRRDHLSCYGHSRPTTPSIDRLAEEGVRFDAAYATSCWTVPSHASLFTGLLPSAHRADLDTQQLDPAIPTLAGLLTARGYRTASISCNGFVAPYTNLTQGFQLAVDVHGSKGSSDGVLGRLRQGIRRRVRRLTERDRGAARATRLARRWLRERSGSDPFLLFLNYMDCHLPYALKGPARYRFVEPEARSRVDALPMDPFAHMAGVRTYSDQEVGDLKSLYDGALRYLDDQIASIRAGLEEAGMLERTLLIVTSDHGESFGEHGLFDHQYGLLENLIRVPLVMRGPGVRAGEVDADLVQLTDVLPTLLDAAAGAPDDRPEIELPGFSMFGPERRKWVFAEYLVPNVKAIERRFPDVDTARLNRPLRAASDGRHKLVMDRSGNTWLYDLIEDPEEIHDRTEELPEVLERCTAAMAEGLGSWPERVVSEASDLTDLQERLEALGYL
jgi:arylsulfatase A-like enzyme